MNVYLETPRLILRELTEDDAPALFELDGAPEVMRYVGPYRLKDPEAYRERISTQWRAYYARNEGLGFWAAVEKEKGVFLGWFHLRPALDYRFATEAGYRAGEFELGYRLLQTAWGKGFATEAARALVHKAFRELDAPAVVAPALVTNVDSTRVLEKSGLRRGAEFTITGYDDPAVRYALHRAEFDRGDPR